MDFFLIKNILFWHFYIRPLIHNSKAEVEQQQQPPSSSAATSSTSTSSVMATPSAASAYTANYSRRELRKCEELYDRILTQPRRPGSSASGGSSRGGGASSSVSGGALPTRFTQFRPANKFQFSMKVIFCKKNNLKNNKKNLKCHKNKLNV